MVLVFKSPLVTSDIVVCLDALGLVKGGVLSAGTCLPFPFSEEQTVEHSEPAISSCSIGRVWVLRDENGGWADGQCGRAGSRCFCWLESIGLIRAYS